MDNNPPTYKRNEHIFDVKYYYSSVCIDKILHMDKPEKYKNVVEVGEPKDNFNITWLDQYETIKKNNKIYIKFFNNYFCTINDNQNEGYTYDYSEIKYYYSKYINKVLDLDDPEKDDNISEIDEIKNTFNLTWLEKYTIINKNNKIYIEYSDNHFCVVPYIKKQNDKYDNIEKKIDELTKKIDKLQPIDYKKPYINDRNYSMSSIKNNNDKLRDGETIEHSCLLYEGETIRSIWKVFYKKDTNTFISIYCRPVYNYQVEFTSLNNFIENHYSYVNQMRLKRTGKGRTIRGNARLECKVKRRGNLVSIKELW